MAPHVRTTSPWQHFAPSLYAMPYHGKFINGHLGFEARNGSVYFVSGCDKATTWGIAAI
ncbi:hypothetical protein FIBSPDRAFT_380284 [Athelia psychrophila]|uniref:Uncharacterized protein n=1 Tax=Athelia psychrophila TaxID=1759441 RepID=A0A166P5W0_9AGAM|nr:hypothetical protein FIBSPDRAFT_380284 [Fibularhizoctonia sp. CBS 109695]